MLFQEDKHTELKQSYSVNIMKTISAFSNNEGGKIIIGIKDDGEIVGVGNSTQSKLNLENSINDLVSPVPNYDLDIISVEGKKLLVINVYKGKDVPYFYKSMAYTRKDTSTTPLDRLELKRLILKGKNLSYDQVSSSEESLSFKYLESEFKKRAGINTLGKNNLASIGLITDDKYNIAAELLSDEGVSNSYVDIAKFKLSNDVFEDRVYINNKSLLEQHDIAIKVFNIYYKPHEIVRKTRREVVEPVPLEAFKEALNNAIIHRDYLQQGGIQIAMYDNRIIITSPGGLPEGVSEEVYLSGQVSKPRNPLISFVFFRLGLIEQFGTGIGRIVDAYNNTNVKPSFIISENFIRVVLPVIDYDYSLFNDKDAIVAYLLANPHSTRSDIEKYLKIEKHSVSRRLNELVESGLVLKYGSGPSTNYSAR